MPRQLTLKVSYQYINWVFGTNRAIMGHLYQFTALDGANDYFTDLDTDITYSGQVWKSNSLRFEGLKRKVSIGVNVDEQSVKIWASPTDTLWGSVFLPGAEQGLMSGATVVRSRIIWPFVTGNAYNDVQLQPLACWPLFTGYISSIDKGGTSHIEVKVKSPMMRLMVNMPRNYYQPGCLWTLFDPGCTLEKATFAVTGTIGPNPSATIIPIVGGVSPAIGADGIANFAQGRLLFTSGNNDNLLTLIDNNDATSLVLAYPLDERPAAGDMVTFYPGCSKSHNTCQVKFGNQGNYRGFDLVPPVMVSV